MSDSNAPLDRIRRAHEEDYFQKQNQALIAAMKRKLDVQAAAEGLGATTGITDNALLERLANFGFDAETAAVIHLVPLIEVAWASGEIEPDEKELLLEAATAHGVTGGAAKAKFDGMLAVAPPAEMLDAALDFIKALLVALPDDQSEEACLGLTELSYKIAEANGGVFGLFFKVDDEEKAVLRRIAERLSASYPDAARRLIDRL